MNFSFDWGAVVVASVGAAGSIFVMKNDMKWLKQSIERLESEIRIAHKRIDALLGRDHNARYSDGERA